MSHLTDADIKRRAYFARCEAERAPHNRVLRWLYFRRRLFAWATTWCAIGLMVPWLPTIPFSILVILVLTALSGSGGHLPGSSFGA